MDVASKLSLWVVWGGFALALVFGFVAARGNFCTMGALSDIVNMAHWVRMRTWLLAMAVAILGTAALAYGGAIDLSRTIYHRPVLPWLSLVVGGALFGVGMTMAGGCANRNLIRVGAGSVRALVVLVFLGISAYMTLKGLFGQWRATLLDPVAIDLSGWSVKTQGLGELLAAASGLPARTAALTAAVVLGLALLAFVFKDARYRGNGTQIVTGVVLGLLVTAGWYLTGHIGFAENPETLEMSYFATNTRTLESFSFVAPVAYALELLMLWTDKSLKLTFGIASALGIVLGSLAWALYNKSFRWEGFANFQDLRNQLVGAMLMGFGGVTAMGCTVGQGLSGISTLALGSLIALLSICAGCVGMLRWMARG